MLYQYPSIAPTITSFPVEILAEIFLHCLPDSPLNEAQPNLRVAPMLLCHVCSSWRAIAFSLPRLWSHLCVSLPMRKGNTTDPVTWNFKLEALPNMMKFMGWWRGHQRLSAPFIRIKSGQEDGIDEGLLPDDVVAFLFQYLLSAQYIDIARSLLTRMLPKSETEETEIEYHGLSLNLRALVVECGKNLIEEEDSFLFYSFPISIPATLRRLSLRGAHMTEVTPLENWSLLTHISLDDILMHSSDWNPLIRIFRNLQWGFFNIYIDDAHPSEYSPLQTTLPCLRTLILIVDDPFARLVLADPPTQLFFMNIYLPALRNLSMKSRSTTWKHPVPSNAIAEIKNLLRLAPKIQNLALGPQFLCFKDHSDSDAPSAYHESCSEIDTFSSLAPSLSHLQLELPYRHEWEGETVILDRLALWCRAFSYMHWLDLESPKNAIRKITVLVQTGRNASLVEGLVRDKLTAFIEQYKQKVPGVEFEIIWEKKEGKSRSVDEWSTCGSI